MKILFGVFLFTALISVVLGATAIELTDNSTDHPGHCYSKSENVGAMEKGEIKTLKGECVQATCREDTSIAYFSCGAIDHPPPNCKISDVDLSKPYPDCCPDISCS